MREKWGAAMAYYKPDRIAEITLENGVKKHITPP